MTSYVSCVPAATGSGDATISPVTFARGLGEVSMPTPGVVFCIETAASSTSFHGGGDTFGSNARLLAARTLW